MSTSITTLIVRNTNLTCKTKGSAKGVKASGSMMRATAKALLTGIRRLLKSTGKGAQVKRLSRGRTSVAKQIGADRTFPEEVAIAGVAEGNRLPPSRGEGPGPDLAGNRASPRRAVVKVLLAEVRGAVRRNNKATAALQAVRA
jgi:hypothetical protein